MSPYGPKLTRTLCQPFKHGIKNLPPPLTLQLTEQDPYLPPCHVPDILRFKAQEGADTGQGEEGAHEGQHSVEVHVSGYDSPHAAQEGHSERRRQHG